MPHPPPRVMPFGDEAIAEAARLIRDGQPVAVPTETVYGLAADATNAKAVARIYAAKGRPSFNPLIVHVADLAAAEKLGEFDDRRAPGAAHWPGPLTLVVPLRPDAAIASLVTAGLPSIALRVPAHPGMQALLAACGRPLAAPSANASGRISPTRAAHVVASLGDRIALVIDGGATERGIESTSSPRPAARCACSAAARSTSTHASTTRRSKPPASSPATTPHKSPSASTRPTRATTNI